VQINFTLFGQTAVETVCAEVLVPAIQQQKIDNVRISERLGKEASDDTQARILCTAFAHVKIYLFCSQPIEKTDGPTPAERNCRMATTPQEPGNPHRR
jgi:hypothetical protein